jgi:DNA-binding transcriptional MocR family regulator
VEVEAATGAEPFATKSDLAYRRVRELILSGELPPGSVLQQAVLARTIGMSTTPLREALRLLKQEGLVELDAHRCGSSWIRWPPRSPPNGGPRQTSPPSPRRSSTSSRCRAIRRRPSWPRTAVSTRRSTGRRTTGC